MDAKGWRRACSPTPVDGRFARLSAGFSTCLQRVQDHTGGLTLGPAVRDDFVGGDAELLLHERIAQIDQPDRGDSANPEGHPHPIQIHLRDQRLCSNQLSPCSFGAECPVLSRGVADPMPPTLAGVLASPERYVVVAVSECGETPWGADWQRGLVRRHPARVRIGQRLEASARIERHRVGLSGASSRALGVGGRTRQQPPSSVHA
jgi:hypothetical protein